MAAQGHRMGDELMQQDTQAVDISLLCTGLSQKQLRRRICAGARQVVRVLHSHTHT